MIVDLARNDLGRVCEYGSITVPALCAVEAHPGLHHLVSTVRGHVATRCRARRARARDVPAGVGHRRAEAAGAAGDRRPRAGAPRRLLRRGRMDRRRRATAPSSRSRSARSRSCPARPYLGVGGGIVADSNPDAEWAETELKAARLLAAAAGGAVGRGASDDRLARRRARSPLDDARISPLDHGLTRRRRRVRDAARLRRRAVRVAPAPRAARALGRRARARAPRRRGAARRRRRACSRRTSSREARLRITVTGGPAPLGSRARRRRRRP